MSEPLPIPGKISVFRSIINWLSEREKKGVLTYGRTLETHNGRAVARDLREELLDSMLYAEQLYLERKDEQTELVQMYKILKVATGVAPDEFPLAAALHKLEQEKKNAG